ncbi:MAG: hypothetical protein AB7P21_17395 [Lautropia sp.]
MRPPLWLACGAAILLQLLGCERPPPYVYVLQAPQSIDLEASASVDAVKADVPFLLHTRRQTRGVWKRIPSKELKPDQCWMAAVPPESEPEVADNMLWRVEPASGVRFNTDFRPNRTREVRIANPGTYTFVASYGPWCEHERTESAAPVTVIVEAR